MMYLLLTLLLFVVPTKSAQSSNGIYYCDNCDLLLGGLAPIHDKSSNKSNFGECNYEGFKDHALPRVEAMLFAVDKINNDTKLLNGITLGIHILDTCGITTIVTKKAKVFVEDLWVDQCNISETGEHLLNRPHFAGVIGGMYSSVSLAVANVLQLWHIPQVSPASTSVKLSDKERYPFFARTVPSDTYQFNVIIDILKRLNWALISTVVSEGSYGEQGRNKFTARANEKGICSHMSLTVPNNPTMDDFKDILCKILYHPNSKVMVLLTNIEDTSRILTTWSYLQKQHTEGKT